MKKHTWDAEGYHFHSAAQQEAALDLLKSIHLKGDEEILDVGCGDGKITAHIAQCVPQGKVIGIDASEQMIEFAKKRFSKPNLTFVLQEAQKFNGRFDVIFSSFALQWVFNISDFLQRAKKSLKSKGHLVITVPLGISQPLEQALEVITKKVEWRSYFKGFVPSWHLRDEKEWKRLLYRFQVKKLQVVPQQAIFPSREHFEGYVWPWLAYLNYLPEGKKESFFKQIIDRYLELEKSKNGCVPFHFSRLDIIATL